jgi:hypothetical protein
MDYVSNSAVLRAIVRTIEADVIPALSDSYKRSQLWATTGLLGNIANDLELSDADLRGSVGEDLEGFLRSAGLERALEGSDGVADAAAAVRENLASVIGGHATLHYRRAVGGFDEDK